MRPSRAAIALCTIVGLAAAGCLAPSNGASPTIAPTGADPVPVAAGEAPKASSGQPGGCVVVRVGEQGAASADEARLLGTTSAHGPRIIFLNRHGGTYYPGNGYDNSSANQSSLLSTAVTMPPYSRSDAEWNQLVELTRQTYAPFNIEVTDVDPGNQAHVEVVVSGSPQMIGQPATAAGVSPLAGNCGVIERAVVFAFDNLLQGPDDQARVVTHEAGHAFGLDHEFLCSDMMSYLFNCAWPKHFVDQTAYCGEYQSRACSCGTGSQDSVQHLYSVLGAHQDGGVAPADGGAPPSDGTPPSGGPQFVLGDPASGASVSGNGNVSVSATVTAAAGLTQEVLDWELNGQLIQFNCDAMPNGYSCTRSGDTVTFTLRVGTGVRTWSVQATDTAGVTTRSERRSFTLTDPQSQLPVLHTQSPMPAATYAAGDTVQLRVQVDGPYGISQSWLTWTAPTGTVQYPLAYLGGDWWGLDLPISSAAGPGPRSLTINAYDPYNQVGSTQLSINVQ